MSIAAGIPQPCNPLFHCAYEPGAHLSVFELSVQFALMGALLVGVPLLLRLTNRGPGGGWWHRSEPPPDDPRPPLPDAGTTRPQVAPGRSHRRRPPSLRSAHGVSRGNSPVGHR